MSCSNCKSIILFSPFIILQYLSKKGKNNNTNIFGLFVNKIQYTQFNISKMLNF